MTAASEPLDVDFAVVSPAGLFFKERSDGFIGMAGAAFANAAKKLIAPKLSEALRFMLQIPYNVEQLEASAFEYSRKNPAVIIALCIAAASVAYGLSALNLNSPTY